MLQSIKNKTAGWITWFIVILVALTFVIVGIENFQARGESKPVATVNGIAISEYELQMEYERFRRQQIASQDEDAYITPAIEASWKQKVLQGLIEQELLKQTAQQMKFQVSDAQAHTIILEAPEFQEDGAFSTERYQQLLSSINYSNEAFVQQLRDDLLIQQLRSSFTVGAFVSSEEAAQAARLLGQKRDIAYLTLTEADFAAQVELPSELEIKDFYAANLENFITPEKVSIEYIQLSQANLLKEIVLEKGEIENYYEQNKASFVTPGRWQIAHILIEDNDDAAEKIKNLQADIKKDKKFAELVKAYSDDVFSSKENGVLPWFYANTFAKPIEEVVLKMEVGEISEPIKTDNAYEIIKLLDKEPPKQKPLAELRSNIEQQLKLEKAQKRFAELSADLSNITYANPDTLEIAAQELALSVQSSELFTSEAGVDVITKNPRILAAAFSTEVKENGNNSDLISLDTDSLIVLRIKQHQPQMTQPLSAVSEEIKQTLAQQARQHKAKTVGEKLQLDLQAGSITRAAAAAQLKKSWQTHKGILRTDQNIAARLLEHAFSTHEPISGLVLENGDYVIVIVDNIEQGKFSELSAEQKTILRQQLESNQSLITLGVLMQDWRNQATID